MNVYDFRHGHSLKNVNPQQVGEELERLREEKGTLLPADVLEVAANPDSPLHAAFEWDDGEAAKKFRLSQARRLIVSIRVLNSPVSTTAPVYVSVKTPKKGREYVRTTEALGDEELQARVLAEVRQYIEGMERRYSAFTTVAATLRSLKQKIG